MTDMFRLCMPVLGVFLLLSDLGTTTAPPSYTKTTPIAAANEPGGTGSRRLLLTAPGSGTHYALVTNGAKAPSAELLSAARTELANWAAAKAS